MIAETMAGIALVKGAVDGIKSIINTANDVSDIAGYVDKLFEGEKQVQQKRNKKSGIDNFGGIGGVASEVIDARLAKEKMQDVDERARRLQEEKAKAMEARRIQIQKAREMEELFQNILLVIAIVVVLIIAVVVAINII